MKEVISMILLFSHLQSVNTLSQFKSNDFKYGSMPMKKILNNLNRFAVYS